MAKYKSNLLERMDELHPEIVSTIEKVFKEKYQYMENVPKDELEQGKFYPGGEKFEEFYKEIRKRLLAKGTPRIYLKELLKDRIDIFFTEINLY